MPRAEIKMRHRVLKKANKILVRRFHTEGNEHFNIRFYVEGDLSQVRWVEYHLHETFPTPVRRVTKPQGGFSLDIWTWGEFTVFAVVGFKDGSAQEISYELEYSRELPAEDSAYEDVSSLPQQKWKF